MPACVCVSVAVCGRVRRRVCVCARTCTCARACVQLVGGAERVMLLLDSGHEYHIVKAELELYAPLVRAH